MSGGPLDGLAASRARLARVGPVWQLGYVPDDFDRSLAFWTQVMGAGPFFVRDRIELSDVRFRGAPSDIRFGAALGYWGDVNIELIRQDNDAPSIYRGWRNDGGRDSLHHVCTLVEDLDAAVRSARMDGAEVVQEGRSPEGDGALAYLSFGAAAPAGYLELVQMSPKWKRLHAWLRDEARHWDGSDPVRHTVGYSA